MSKFFEKKQLEIVRAAVDNAERRKGRALINDPKILNMIDIVEDFLKRKKRVCYGGTAINNILPIELQFYDKDVEFPDYDFFSPKALDDAKELADIYHKKGFENITAKAGVHHGTYKVYVDFLPVADITQLTSEIYKSILRDAKIFSGIYYAPPDFLRMAMYLELSRPAGDISRWEKVIKRLTLLEKEYPLRSDGCNSINIQRMFTAKNINSENVFYAVRDALISQDVVFFGAFANRMYLKNLKKFKKTEFKKIPDFDVLSVDPKRTATLVKERLTEKHYKNVHMVRKSGIGEIIAPHYEVKIGPETVVFIYEPLACHSYNTVKIGKHTVKIATIDTMLSFYLAFMFVNRLYYDPQRILCMSEYLFQVQKQNKLKQKGILRRFSIDCYGKQETLTDILRKKGETFEELKKNPNSKEFKEHFFKYDPAKGKTTNKQRKPKKSKKSKKPKKPKKRWTKKAHKKPQRKPRKSKKKRKRKKNWFGLL